MFTNQKTEDGRQRTDYCVPLLGTRNINARRSSDNHPSSVLCHLSSERGISLIELIMFIVIIGIAVAGVLLVMNRVTGQSADPLIRKQAVAIAESLLEEVELMPFTFCDPDDASAVTATSAAGDCAVAANEESTTIGPEAGETRYADPQFDNVSDYHGCQMNMGANPQCDAAGTSIRDITNSPIGALNGYSAAITVAGQALPGIPANESLQITVTVTGPGNTQVVLDGYRTRYAPRSVP